VKGEGIQKPGMPDTGASVPAIKNPRNKIQAIEGGGMMICMGI